MILSMRRNPAIILFLLLLFLGGLVGLVHVLRKEPKPGFTEVDEFLRQTPLPAGWRIVGLASVGSERGPSFGWMKWISRPTWTHTDSYGCHHSRTSREAAIHVTCTDGKITKIAIEPPVKDLKDHLFGKFPGLLPYDATANP